MFISLSKKSIIAAMSALILIIFICGEFSAAGQNNIPAKTNAERLEFISSLNIKSENACCEEKKLVIPRVFGEVYKNYNSVQKKAGFDLSAFAGCEARVYSYKITDQKEFGDNAYVHLIVYKNCVIGGDISSTELAGFMLPLAPV